MPNADSDEYRWRAEQIDSASQAIRRYLSAHPIASDTLQGVRDWWLAGQAETWSLDVIQAALDRMVDAHVLERREIPGGVLYGRAKDGGCQ